jgi:SAM-dependent methyltransferase
MLEGSAVEPYNSRSLFVHLLTNLLRMSETINANLYDFPKYYDLIFGSDWKAEFDFLKDCFAKHAKRPVKRVFEPACGTGRLLVKLGQDGYEVSGNDLNERAIKFCNDRFERYGLPRSAFVGDMADFKLKKKVDAAFNMINSFRHLATEKEAVAHLRCVAEALNKGGLYMLGLHLTPVDDDWEGEEEWHARRGNLSVISKLWTTGFDRKARMEQLHLRLDATTPTKSFTLNDVMHYRTYTRFEIKSLIKKIPAFEIVETYDFCYDIDDPIVVDEMTEDVVYVLRKK